MPKIVCCLLQEPIIFRRDNKKMMHSERLALLTRWLAKLGSDLLLLL